MDTNVPQRNDKLRFHAAISPFRRAAASITRMVAWWTRFTDQRSLQRLEDLNDYELRDIGLWREAKSRVDHWWLMNPPP